MSLNRCNQLGVCQTDVNRNQPQQQEQLVGQQQQQQHEQVGKQQQQRRQSTSQLQLAMFALLFLTLLTGPAKVYANRK